MEPTQTLEGTILKCHNELNDAIDNRTYSPDARLIARALQLISHHLVDLGGRMQDLQDELHEIKNSLNQVR
jgi:hypothetical protein